MNKLLHHHFTLVTYQFRCQNLIVHRIQNLQNKIAYFWGLGFLRPVCLKKAQHLEVFCLIPLWNLNFGISKVIFLLNFWPFWDYFTKSAIPHHNTFFISQGNLRMSRDQFWSLLILRQKFIKNYCPRYTLAPKHAT